MDELRTDPPIGLPPNAWSRFRARVLDPATALQREGQDVRPTTYVTDTLLVRTSAERGGTPDALRRVLDAAGLTPEPDAEAAADRERIGAADPSDEERALLEDGWVERVRLVPSRRHDRPAVPVDAWDMLQAYRLEVGDGARELGHVGLEHLVVATSIGGTPFTIPHGSTGTPFTIPHGSTGTPFTIPHGGNGVASYAVPGLGGRQPVAWLGPPPQPRHDLGGAARRPVVAVLDTGVCSHPWLDDGHVIRDPEVLGSPLGIPPLVPDSEAVGTRDPLVGGIEPDAGHGTFIAGLVRQRCPDATVLAVRVFRGDGVVAEGDLITAVRRLVLWHLRGLRGDPERPPVDVLSLSLGYYHEQPEDPAFDALLLAPLGLLGRLGVTVVVSSGNDATTRPMYPAAFAPYPGGPARAELGPVPLLAVGALNPDGTVAMFSNDGEWVRYLRPGASVVSTYPPSIDTSANAIASHVHRGLRRSSIDPDGYRSGFATWSGTSFSAPVLAGEVAAALQDRFDAGDGDAGARAAVKRARSVLEGIDPGTRGAQE